MLTAVSIAKDDINLTYNNRSMFILSCLPVCPSLFSLVCLTVHCYESRLSRVILVQPFLIYFIRFPIFQAYFSDHGTCRILSSLFDRWIRVLLFKIFCSCAWLYTLSVQVLLIFSVEMYSFVIHWCCRHHSHTMFSSEHMLLTSCHQIDWPYTSPHFILTKAW